MFYGRPLFGYEPERALEFANKNVAVAAQLTIDEARAHLPQARGDIIGL